MDPAALRDQLIPVVYQDDDLTAVVKPAGVDVSARRDSAIPGVIEILESLGGGEMPLLPANRLSRFESGILLLASSEGLVRKIKGAFRDGKVTCEYLALITGRPAGKVTRIGEAPGHKNAPIAVKPRRSPRTNPASAMTTLTVLKAEQKRSCIRCTTHVENTHALRAQLRGAKVRLVGDKVNERHARRDTAHMTFLHLEKMTFVHPVHGKRVQLRAPSPMASADVVRDGVGVVRHLLAALVRRLPCLVDARSTAYRLLSGDKEHVPGLVAERFGALLLLTVREPANWSSRKLGAVAQWYYEMLRLRTAVARFPGSQKESDDASPAILQLRGRGELAETVVWEDGAMFHVRPWQAGPVGLFLDQRENRRWIRSESSGRRVLNLFAHTCGFSVSAALGGADAVTSVDLSRPNLDWGKQNFLVSGLDPEGYQFVVDDAESFLRRALRDGQRFGLVIIDAPTFAHGKKRGRSFAFERDLPRLLRSTAAVVDDGGVVMITTNSRRLSMMRLRELVAQGVSKGRYRVIATPQLPADFAVDPDHAKTIVLRLGH